MAIRSDQPFEKYVSTPAFNKQSIYLQHFFGRRLTKRASRRAPCVTHVLHLSVGRRTGDKLLQNKHLGAYCGMNAY